MKTRVPRIAGAVLVAAVMLLPMIGSPVSASGIDLTHLPGFENGCVTEGQPAKVVIQYVADVWSPFQVAIDDTHSGTEDMSIYQPDRNYEKFHIRRLNGPGSAFTVLRSDMRRYPGRVDFRGQEIRSNHGSYVMVYEFERGTPAPVPTCPDPSTSTTTTTSHLPNACPPGSDFEFYTWNGETFSCNRLPGTPTTTSTTHPPTTTTTPGGGGPTTTTPGGGGPTTTTTPGGGGPTTTTTTAPPDDRSRPDGFDCVSNVEVSIPEFFYATGDTDPQTVTVTPSSLVCTDCQPFTDGPGPQLTSLQVTLSVTGTNGYDQYAVTRKVDPVGLGTHSATMVFYVPTDPYQSVHIDVSASGTCAVYDQRSTEIRTISGQDWEVEVFTPTTYPLNINWWGSPRQADVGVIFATAIPRFGLK